MKECCKVKEIIPGDLVTIITNDLVIKTKAVILAAGKSFMKIMSSFLATLKAVCHAFDWVIWTIRRIGNLNGC